MSNKFADFWLNRYNLTNNKGVKYMDLLEDFVHHLTKIIFDRNYK